MTHIIIDLPLNHSPFRIYAYTRRSMAYTSQIDDHLLEQ